MCLLCIMALRFPLSTQRILLLLLLVAVLLINIHRSPLLLEEPRRALVAMEMLYSGDYLVPQIHGEPYLNKPPFFNWMILIGYKLFGVQDWIPRSISLLSLMGLSLLTFRMARKELDAHSAWLAALMVPLSADILFYFSFLGEIDLFYALLSFGLFYSLYSYGGKQQWGRMFLWVWLLAAMGVLTKGLPSVVFAGLSLTAYLVWKGQWKVLFSPRHLMGLGVFILPLSIYFWAYNERADGVALLENLFFESANRLGENGKTGWDHLWRILYFPLALSWQYTLPWGFFLLALLFRDLKKVPKPNLLVFVLLLTLVNIWPYWLASGTRSRYLYMFFPFVSITAAWIWKEWTLRNSRFFREGIPLVFSYLALLPLLGWLAFSGIVLGDFSIPPAFFWLMLAVSLMVILVFFWVKKRKMQALYGFFFTLILLRGVYGFLLTENRIMNSNAANDKAIALAIAGEAGGGPLFLHPSVQGLSFTISYYLEKELQTIIPYAIPSNPGNYLIMDSVQNRGDQVLFSFPGRDQTLVLVRK